MIRDSPLDELADQLVVPSRSGFYIAKSELIVLAHLSEGSLRVNERRRMLADVLKSPDTLEGLSALIGRIESLAQAHQERYRELIEAYPAMADVLRPRQEKLEATLRHLAETRDELSDG